MQVESAGRRSVRLATKCGWTSGPDDSVFVCGVWNRARGKGAGRC